MIDKSFLEKIELMSVPTVFEIDGISRSNQKLYDIRPPMASAFNVRSLNAVLDFCADEMSAERHLLHIVNHSNVALCGPMDSVFRTRECFVHASSFEYDFKFGKYYQVEEFIIALQAQFLQDETTAAIMKLVGNMTKESETTTKDDGVTQRVEAKVGLAKVAEVAVPNPVSLAPFRTFVEIDQPYSNFVLRLNANHQCALFEADGGSWKIESMKRIRAFLDAGLKAIGKRDQITILC